MTDFEQVWARIQAYGGKELHTIRGLAFTYTVSGATAETRRTDFPLSKTDFRAAHEAMPVTGPGEIKTLVRGPSYVFDILTDPRIRV